MRSHQLRRLVSIGGLAVAVAIAAPAQAGLVLTVTSEDDVVDTAPGDARCLTSAGGCSLRAAVQEANATPGRDEVILPAGYFGFDLPGENEDTAEAGDLDLTDDIAITGAGADRSHVDGGGLGGVFQVWPGVRAELRGLSISGGLQRPGVENAAGIDNQGELYLADAAVVANVAPIPYGHGGLMNSGLATIERSVFDSNAPTAITNEGALVISQSTLRYNGPALAIDSDEGALTLIASDIAFQTGTALFCQAGSMRIERSRIHHTRPGAAILVPSGSVTVVESMLDHNEGGGINNDGSLTITRSTLQANSPAGDDGAGSANGVAGGVSYTAVDNTSNAVIVDSAILDHRGGGLYDEQGSMTLINVTVSGNSARFDGGGVTNNGELVIRSSTIVGNTSPAGAGIVTYADAANSLRISNSIVAGNSAGIAADCSGPITSEGHNLIGTGCAELTAAAGDKIGVEPGLLPLADNGGPTLTHAPLPTSPAIDGGDPSPPGSNPIVCPLTDQRGAGRPQGAACDIGAVEVTTSCGNGTQDSGEACDDGNTVAGDCCSPLCTFEPLAGDCDANGAVDVAELIRAVDLALAAPPPLDCQAADTDGDGRVTISDLLRAVRSALNGCLIPPP